MSQTAPASQEPGSPRRHRDRQGASLLFGVVLILLGVVFILERTGLFTLSENWWAIFIYVAAIASFANAWRAYRASGVFGPQATGSLTWGLVLTVVASIFMFNLLWDVWWPAILIAAGVGIVAGYGLNALSGGPSGG